jgi:hypothetical protein
VNQHGFYFIFILCNFNQQHKKEKNYLRRVKGFALGSQRAEQQSQEDKEQG